MTLLQRPKDLRSPAEYLREEFKLPPGETKEARFDAWLADRTANPRFCKRHPRTQLVLNDCDRSIEQAFAEYGSYHPSEIRPGVFFFCAALRCPACRCAYALCPPEFHTTSFETFDTSTTKRADALAGCREFTAQVNKNGCGDALLVGGPGTGKTRLACNIIRELESTDALYVRQGQLTNALRTSYGRKHVFLHRRQWRDDEDDEGAGNDEPPTPLEVVQGVRFLVLDEIGCAALANDERLMLNELLKHRYDERKPTILVSNLPLDQLKEFLGDALYDRIRHAAGGGKFILQFMGESYRHTAGENYLEGLG